VRQGGNRVDDGTSPVFSLAKGCAILHRATLGISSRLGKAQEVTLDIRLSSGQTKKLDRRTGQPWEETSDKSA
jgi:hypothetical protein